MKPSGTGYRPAVMASRNEPLDSLDFFPTPPWGTRALIEYVLRPLGLCSILHTVWEPAAGEGHMVWPLREYFASLYASDVHDYGRGFAVGSFVGEGIDVAQCPFQPDWIITNPPFRLGEEFVRRALDEAKVGVAMLARTAFIESESRYSIFSGSFSVLAPFSRRLSMVKGRYDPGAQSATSYAWFVWAKRSSPHPAVVIIPPKARLTLERAGDFDAERAA